MISISNIAWDVSLDERVAELLDAHEISKIDIAPPKYFSDPCRTSQGGILKVKEFWSKKGITPIGMQSLLFGTQGLNVFGSSDIQEKLLLHLSHICRIGALLGARKLVFGSPKNRDRGHLSDTETDAQAIKFFRRLGDIAQEHDVILCLEPNPICYQANFMTNSLETVEVVRKINHKHIGMQLDIGAMQINDEAVDETIAEVAPWIQHIHISEPQLVPLDINNKFHHDAAKAIHSHLPDMPMTIEMLTTNSTVSLEEIEQSIQVMEQVYLGY